MGILNKLIGAAGTPAIEAVGGVMGAVFQNKQEKLSHEEVMARLAQNPQAWQAEINKIEAQHRSVFVAGARPAILWVCAAGLGFVFLVNPILQWSTGAAGPDMPTEAMMSLVVSILGLGGYRTIEKLQGRTK